MTRLTTIDFRGDTLFGIEQGAEVFVAVTPICEALGLAPQKQRERILRDPILSEGGTTMVAPSAGGPQDTFCLRLDLLHGWLFTIDHARAREEIRDRIILYKRECYAVLDRHFFGGPAVRGEVVPQPDLPEAIRLRMVTEARMVFGTRAAAEVWFALGLPQTPAMRGRSPLLEYGGIGRCERQAGTRLS